MKVSKKWMCGLGFLALAILLFAMTALAAGEETAKPAMYATFWAMIPPLVAIVLALITKEVYSSLFLGILVGALFYSDFSFEGTVTHIFQGGIVSVLSDSYNVGILVFLVILGVIVSLMNQAGGSAAFGRWASRKTILCHRHFLGNLWDPAPPFPTPQSCPRQGADAIM